jgi:hypothetical protein
MLTGFLENMNVGDLSVTFEIKNCLISSSVSLAFVGAFFAVINTSGYCSENSACFGPLLLKVLGTFLGIFTSAVTSLFICRPRFADFSQLQHVAGVMANPFTTARLSGKDVVINGVIVTSELKAVMDSWNLKDFLSMGKNIAQVFIDSIINKKVEIESALPVAQPAKVSRDNIGDTLTGFL